MRAMFSPYAVTLKIDKNGFLGQSPKTRRSPMAEAPNKEARKFSFKVNGIEIESEQQRVVANKILELAKKAGAMPGNP